MPILKHRLVVLELIKSFTIEKTTCEVFQFIAIEESLNVNNLGGVYQLKSSIMRTRFDERFDVVDLYTIGRSSRD